jgi:8-oxo-dGTP diphosphatase
MYKNNIDKKLLEELKVKLKEDGIQKVVAGAVISFLDDKILLLERTADEFKGGLVELPSGGVDQGESVIEGLAREVKKETGLDVSEINRYLGSFDYQSSSGKKARQFNFAVSVQSGEVKINPSEHSRFHLVNPTSNEFQGLNILEKTREVIRRSLNS